MRAFGSDEAPDVRGSTPGVSIEYCGEWFQVQTGTSFAIGREADLSVDENPVLHPRVLEISEFGGLWLLRNIGARLTVTVTDDGGRLRSWLAPGGRLPLVFGRTSVVFTAGPTTYELSLHLDDPLLREIEPRKAEGTAPAGDVTFTLSQRHLILALAEPMLLREGGGMGEIPTSAKAAERLGWSITRFNRKLDNVCDKLDRMGVQGLRGGARSYATNRRMRLVDYAIRTRIVTSSDLPLLDVKSAE